MENTPHYELHQLKLRLQRIHDDIDGFQPLSSKPPIIDSSFEGLDEANDDSHWLQQEEVPGLKKLKANIKIDLGILEKFLEDPNCAKLPPLSTNAPYVIAVWNEVLCARPPIVSVFRTYLSEPEPPHKPSPPDRTRNREKQNPPGAKVDVVADNGRSWIRVNTVKNSRLLSEFREIDSYLTDSECGSDDDEETGGPTLAQAEFDNSVLRMGRSLLEAAKATAIERTSEIPQVILRLTRLDPSALNRDGTEPDPRIARTLDCLRELGVEVQLGERSEEELAFANSALSDHSPQSSSSPPPLVPSTNINLDLSMLIALISDLTHASLPSSTEEANRRFVPPLEYREWKQKRKEMSGKPPRKPSSRHPPRPERTEAPGTETNINHLPYDLIKHSKALTNQLLQEMGHSMMQEIYDRIQASDNPTLNGGDLQPKTVFWTTVEARDRCLRIISKIGGVHEKRRARALFRAPDADDVPVSDEPPKEIPLEEAQDLYWQGSRFPLNFIPLLPIRLYPVIPTSTPSDISLPTDASLTPDLLEFTKLPKPSFFHNLDKTCAWILSQETIPHPRSQKQNAQRASASASSPSSSQVPTPFHDEIQRASVTKANPRLTAHTVLSMQWGARLGWTTLTANRSSVKAMLREMKEQRLMGQLDPDHAESQEDLSNGHLSSGEKDSLMAIWIMNPRSLAEGMSSQQV